MTEYTPGPWKAEIDRMGCKNVYSPCLRAEGGDGGIFAGGCGTKIGFTHGRFPEGEDAANARLIAAAPDLLAALEEVMSANEFGDGLPSWSSVFDVCQDAIAKALDNAPKV